MSEAEGSFWLNLLEKFLGLIILIVGIMTGYYTFTSTQILSDFVGLFGFLSIILVILGLVLLIAKIE